MFIQSSGPWVSCLFEARAKRRISGWNVFVGQILQGARRPSAGFVDPAASRKWSSLNKVQKAASREWSKLDKLQKAKYTGVARRNTIKKEVAHARAKVVADSASLKLDHNMRVRSAWSMGDGQFPYAVGMLEKDMLAAQAPIVGQGQSFPSGRLALARISFC